MNKRHTILVAITSLMVSTVSLQASSAENNPSPAVTLSPYQLYELEMIKFKIEMRIYQDARIVRVQQLRSISITFNKALRQAYKDYNLTGRSASSKAAFAAARAVAAADRDKAVADLEPLMDPPEPPAKPDGYMPKGNKSKAPSPKTEKRNKLLTS